MLVPKFSSASFQPGVLSSPSHPFPSHSLEHSRQTEPQLNFKCPHHQFVPTSPCDNFCWFFCKVYNPISNILPPKTFLKFNLRCMTFISKLREKGFTPILQDPTKFSSSLEDSESHTWIWEYMTEVIFPKLEGKSNMVWKPHIGIAKYYRDFLVCYPHSCVSHRLSTKWHRTWVTSNFKIDDCFQNPLCTIISIIDSEIASAWNGIEIFSLI